MSALEFGKPRRRFVPGAGVVLVLLLVLVVGAGFWLAPRFEWHKPQIKISPDSDIIGLGALEIEATDRGSGLKSFNVNLNSSGTDFPLLSEQYEQPVMQKNFTLALSSKLTGLKEGPAVLRISARDRSLWSFFRGNETSVQKNITIDITPPTLELIADDRYVNFGGVGVVVYKPSADAASTGVKIGSYFFPGYKGQVKDHPDHFIAFFAHPYNVGEDQRATLVAVDKAGNTREMRLVYELKNVKYKKSTIPISDEFIASKVAPLLNDVGARQATPQDVFIKVNRDLRKENEDKIRSITTKATPSILWKAAFSQLSNSKVEANFADARTYTYKDTVIDKAYHLGYDLSVTKHYAAEAANSGVVAFVGDLGIYGNTVIIDHGLGLFTLYSHLSSTDVKAGDQVKQGQAIGKTGETGLAAGDHLHFGVYLDGVPILPVEWWDQKWINDNVQPKLDGSSADNIERPKDTKPARKPLRRRKT
ncbi:MAG TPA: M23 family metallopeptidase [Candidatus Binatia bacterium]|jgi:murein DD-endopeptidase MepM/ murein hydrolase activator NlpD|nr:M23 family metallopeptidase [Candidatus Binatia bacterium]